MACKTFRESFEQMFTTEAGDGERLRALECEHPGRIERNFDLLCRYAPTLALEPTIAADWVRTVSRQGQIGISDIHNLVTVQMKIWEMVEVGTKNGVNLATYGKEL